MAKEQVLLIEDDADIREGVRILLESEGYKVLEAEDGRQGLELLNDELDLIILDVMMPGMSGLRTCEEIRKLSNVPVLFLTAKTQESDKMIGLMVGGDDYLGKPFSYAELLGRVKALIRRYRIYMGKQSEQSEQEHWIENSGVRINEDYNEVYVRGELRDLSQIEYQILLLMVQNPRKIFSAQNIYESVWNEPYFYNCNSTVMVHIRNLRVKVEEKAQTPQLIRTIWGKGYTFGS